MRFFVSFVLLAGMIACNTRPSEVTSFTAQRVSPAPGSSINAADGPTITISGPLSIREGMYFTMVFVRDDGVVFFSGETGPSSSGSSWDEYTFSQGVRRRGYVSEEKFSVFCRGTITQAAFVASNTSILIHTGLNHRGTHIYDNFNWNIVSYRVDIPLNYICN